MFRSKNSLHDTGYTPIKEVTDREKQENKQKKSEWTLFHCFNAHSLYLLSTVENQRILKTHSWPFNFQSLGEMIRMFLDKAIVKNNGLLWKILPSTRYAYTENKRLRRKVWHGSLKG